MVSVERAGDFAAQNALVLRMLASVEGNLGFPSEQERS